MGFVSYQEDIQERDEELQHKHDRQSISQLSDPLKSALTLDEIEKKIETYNYLIDLAADPEVRWAEKALEYQAQLDRALHRVQYLEQENERLRETLRQERKAHATEMKRLRDKHERELQEYAHKLWQGLRRQDKGSQLTITPGASQ